MQKLIKRSIPKFYGIYLNTLALYSKEKAAIKAFHIFCTVRKGRVLPHQKFFLDAAKEQVLIIGSHKVQTYHWKGNRETVLLVHGWESNVFRWRNLIEKLKKEDFNIIAFDAPGHGNSTGKFLHVPLYEKALGAIMEKYAPKTLIGHSIGGMTVMYNQYLHPEVGVGKIVSIAAPSEFYEIMGNYQYLLGLSGRVMHAVEAYVKERFGFVFKEFSTSIFAKDNTKKGLLFHDRSDKIVPYHNSVSVNGSWENSRLISTDGLGHSMHQDDVNNTIIDFLNS